MVKEWNSYSVSDSLLNLAISNDKNQRVQEVSVLFLFKWWNLHHPAKSETPCQMEDERKNLIIKLPQLMSTHSPFVKELLCCKRVMCRQVHHFVRNQVCCFSEDMIRSILVSNDVSEYAIREVMNCNQKQEENKSSFREFRRNRVEKQENKDDVILVL